MKVCERANVYGYIQMNVHIGKVPIYVCMYVYRESDIIPRPETADIHQLVQLPS